MEKEEIMMSSVSVKMMDTRWIMNEDKSFLDLVQILNETDNNAILDTKPVDCLLSGYWDVYKKQIIRREFIPFCIYIALQV